MTENKPKDKTPNTNTKQDESKKEEISKLKVYEKITT